MPVGSKYIDKNRTKTFKIIILFNLCKLVLVKHAVSAGCFELFKLSMAPTSYQPLTNAPTTTQLPPSPSWTTRVRGPYVGNHWDKIATNLLRPRKPE